MFKFLLIIAVFVLLGGDETTTSLKRTFPGYVTTNDSLESIICVILGASYYSFDCALLCGLLVGLLPTDLRIKSIDCMDLSSPTLSL